MDPLSTRERVVAAVHGRQDIPPDPPDEIALADRLRGECTRDQLLDLASKHAHGDNEQDARMRRATWRALARRFGHGVRIGRGALAKQAFIQGRFDGTCVIGDRVWLGPQSYLDARDLVLEESVGWGPGAKVLGSQHTGLPIDVPIINTDLRIEPVRVGAWADIGVNAVIRPGVTVGKGAIVGAGAVVTEDVPSFAIVAGVPARFLRWRTGYQGGA
jgi:acetyltransferase-like isoleucine patch superfamily enzyme